MRSIPPPNPAPHSRVLVVDGDVDNRELYRDSFTPAGWMVAEAGDGREALVMALLSRPSIVLTELRLPLIDGVALCELLRRDRATSTVPILVVTSETRQSELIRAQDAGASGLLIKPSTPDIILCEMERLIRSVRPGPEMPAPSRALPALTRQGRRLPLVKAHRRLATTTPDEPPASLTCPLCGQPLRYEETFIGGVNSRHSERWDYYECGRCGRFQYRYRTRKLRQIV